MQAPIVKAASIASAMGCASSLHPSMLQDVVGDSDAICLVMNKEIVVDIKIMADCMFLYISLYINKSFSK